MAIAAKERCSQAPTKSQGWEVVETLPDAWELLQPPAGEKGEGQVPGISLKKAGQETTRASQTWRSREEGMDRESQAEHYF